MWHIAMSWTWCDSELGPHHLVECGSDIFLVVSYYKTVAAVVTIETNKITND
jgi:hypothetical protein